MSKKETRRAARQAFPKASAKSSSNRYKTYGQRPQRSARPTRSAKARRAGARAALKPPSWKRSVIHGVILAALYLIMIRFIWRDESASTATYVIIPAIGFFIFTGVSYAVDKFTYKRRLRKLEESSK
jgi:hypothetical protein